MNKLLALMALDLRGKTDGRASADRLRERTYLTKRPRRPPAPPTTIPWRRLAYPRLQPRPVRNRLASPPPPPAQRASTQQ
jgi:hypothetical protein